VELRAVVLTGLVVLVAALLPVGLARFGLVERAMWGWASAGFLFAIWVGIVVQVRHPEGREWLRAEAREHPVQQALFWVLLEVPLQVSLLLALFSVIPALDPAFYATALVLNLVEAAYLLARMVLAGDAPPAA